MSIGTLSQLSSMAGSSLDERFAVHGKREIQRVVADSREASAGSLFVALPGERVDGHDYVGKAAELGAVAAIVSRNRMKDLMRTLGTSIALLPVADPLQALQQLAAKHVSRYSDLLKIGVTGSCGKTTTKDMIASICSCMGDTASTPGNRNSIIGLPLSVFAVSGSTRFGVFEMGIDHPGEMDALLDVWKPSHAVITNIGLSHLEKMGSVKNIADEKGRLFHSEIARAYMPEDSLWIDYLAKQRNVPIQQFGMKKSGTISYARSLDLEGWLIGYKGKHMHLHAVGRHNLMDACAAIAVCESLGATVEEISNGLEQFRTSEGRSRVIGGQITIIEDCYNASMDSTMQMLDYVDSVPWNGRKRVVLGSMKELGKAMKTAHEHIARRVRQLAPEETFLFGPEMENAWNYLRKEGCPGSVCYTDDYEELEHAVLNKTRSGDLVLLKGSRAMAMERLVRPLAQIA